jgi:hypothetical protein
MNTPRAVAVAAACLLAVGIPVVTADPAAAAGMRTLVVAPSGSDTAAGTVRAPLRTIQKAVRALAKGGVIELRGGVYHQRVTLRGVAHLTIRPYRHEHPVLSGAGLTVPAGLTALVEISGSRDVQVRGLDLTAYRTTRLGHVPAGIYVHGHDDRVQLVGNHVHDLGNDNSTLGSFDINAHGIAAYGDDPHRAITRLRIARNTVDNLHLGASESVVVNGNVRNWRIVGNRIHDNDNIGIDAIGFEPTLTGKYRYTQANRARNGVIADNTVARIRSRGNPAYWEDGSWCNCADGIYVDGGAHIRISGNVVADSDIGIEVAAENARGRADHVLVRGNRVTGSLYTGITTGGYCNGADDCGGVQTGASLYNTFEYNTLRGNNRLEDGSPELLVQYHAHHDVFRHNTITATNSDHVVYGTVLASDSSGNHSDHNVFRAVGASAASAQFGWNGHTYTGFVAYRAATAQDLHSTFR